jgi:ATP-dependent DNA helicase RecG
MRPFILDPLFLSIQRISGIGPALAKALERLAGPCLLDLLYHFPLTVIDRRRVVTIANLQPGQVNTTKGTVTHFNKGKGFSQPTRITLADETGTLGLAFFKNQGDYLQKNFPMGAERVVSGRVELYNGQPQMAHPDKVTSADKLAQIASLEPVYPLTAGVTLNTIQKAIHFALDKMPLLPEWHDADLVKRESWPTWHDAIRTLHACDDMTTLEPNHVARTRLAYDELLAQQLALALTRHAQQKRERPALIPQDDHYQRAIADLPFSLTDGQKNALNTILDDLQQPYAMCRLLQGDVGSGKTIVALLAALRVKDCGAQTAYMAPTEILARQIYNNALLFAEKHGLRVALLTGREKGKNRERLLMQLISGEIDLLIGTHALVQDPVQFRNLGLVIIDEQHRFGVNQRLTLAQKGDNPHLLVMTATPIPRSLALTVYGDMDVTLITDKPPGRKKIDTRLINQDRLDEVVASLSRKIATGERVFWVCPLVEESEKIDLAAATDRFHALNLIFPNKVGLVHGRMKGDEKDAVMQQFITGQISILVATTVIEVGVNIPEATVMIIEHAERFGLSQLHQLRGRIGRGALDGTCLLIYATPLGETAKKRLYTLRDSDDGFYLAEMDLQLRGAGDVLGTKQSGLPAFKIAQLDVHGDLLNMAQQEAKLILRRDPTLSSERGKALRLLLYLFKRDQVEQFLNAG